MAKFPVPPAVPSNEFLTHLEAALRAAEEGLYYQVFLEEPVESARLIVTALRHGMRLESFQDLLTGLGAEAVHGILCLVEGEARNTRGFAVSLREGIGDVRARRPLLRLLKHPDLVHPVRSALQTLGLPKAPTLSINVLGGFLVTRDGRPIIDGEWKTRKVKTLFKYLVVNKGRCIPRERLADLLWPDSPSQSASMNLRTALATLRRALEPFVEGSASHFVLTRPGGLAFNAEMPYELDTEEFMRCYRAGRAYEAQGQLDGARAQYQEADRLYRGDFMEDEVYEDWTLPDRERFREIHVESLMRLADIADRANHLEEAIELCHRVIGHDRLREEAHQRLMSLYYRSGRPVQAVRQYTACCRALKEDLGVGPSRETRLILGRINGGLQVSDAV